MPKYILVSRHHQLIHYVLNHILPKSSGIELKSHVEPEDIDGRHVIGILPLHLAQYAASITIIPLNTPMGMRGQELDYEQLQQYAGPPQTFIVKGVSNPWD